MLSRDLKRLADTFERWSTGELPPTAEDWFNFRRDIKTCHAKAALLEYGIDVKVVDIAAAVAEPNTNITLFPTPAERASKSGVRHD